MGIPIRKSIGNLETMFTDKILKQVLKNVKASPMGGSTQPFPLKSFGFKKEYGLPEGVWNLKVDQLALPTRAKI